MQSHRDWLLAQHGPVCAYCGTETTEEAITLDHVRPRRGQTAYDRPDNLVLACIPCNAAKADSPQPAAASQASAAVRIPIVASPNSSAIKAGASVDSSPR